MSTYLIAEDDPLHRDFLREVIGHCEIGCTRLAEVDNGEEAIRVAREVEVAGAILDL
ncbi:MAG: hypothetical protein ABI832_12505 [bacterium]